MKIDLVKTREYYNLLCSDRLCDCDYCKLYYLKARKEFPELAAWLEKYGVDIEKPFEVMSIDPAENGIIEYIGMQYIVYGTCSKDISFKAGNFDIRAAHSHPSTGISEEHFVIEVLPMNLVRLSF
ncbi:hypothetical protein [Peptostreptococcus sp. D1]|uniref:hypothetical protein n=1 Tax=Peptostreptococcus sp. D1 TaxID=72304 RepID=UPI0008E083B2|nr:hypothetical protein [Peptostreptococcus sp. D1]SFE54770.1 hypothetical protein SAMN02910278_01105 [Peptostreptococcus sp. D1]